VKNEIELEYYATPGPMTDLSRISPEVLGSLPDTPADLASVVRGCLSTGLPVDGRNDAQIRPAAAMVERICEIDPTPIVRTRSNTKRFVGNCRHYATLTCALLRYKGVPSRVRAGFAGYFEPDTWVDHWIIEYWRPSEERWVRVDPQYGDEFFEAYDPKATSESATRSNFLSGGEAWLKCRSGELDPNRCKMGGVNWGIGEVRGSVLYDVAALNQDEMLPWDVWNQMEAAYRSETDAAYDELLDRVGAVVSGDDFASLRDLYENSSDLKVPAALLPS
jgi:hypothetical protein